MVKENSLLAIGNNAKKTVAVPKKAIIKKPILKKPAIKPAVVINKKKPILKPKVGKISALANKLS